MSVGVGNYSNPEMPDFRHCARCGGVITAAHSVWCDDGKMAHGECIDWTARPFRWDDDIKRARGVWFRTGGEARIAVAEYGKFLARMKKAWPRDAYAWVKARSRMRLRLRAVLEVRGVDERTRHWLW